MNILERIWNWNPGAAKETGGMIEAVGVPNPLKAGDGFAGEVLDLTPNYGPQVLSLAFKQSDIPTATQTDNVIKFVKKLRNQSRIRQKLNEVADMVVQGFRIKGSDDVNNWFIRAEVYQTVQRIAFELLSLGWCVVYVTEDKKGIPTLKVLHNVAVKRGIDGAPHVWLQLDDFVKQAIMKNPKAYPKYWQQELYADPGIDITRVYDGKAQKVKQGGAYFISISTEPEDVYPTSPLYTLASHIIASERMLLDMDSMVEKLATVLTQITVGNKDGQDMRGGKAKVVEKDRTAALGTAFTSAKKSGTIITPGDVAINTVAPASNPYQTQMETAASQFSVVTQGLGAPDIHNVRSEGTADLLARSMFPTIDRVRHGIITQGFLKIMLLDIADRVSGSDKARILYGLDSIIDQADKLNTAKFRWVTGGLSIRAINEMFDPDYDLDAEMLQKQEESSQYKDIVPLLWEPSQGLSTVALEDAKPTGPAPADGSTPAPAPAAGGKKPAAPKKPAVSPKAPGTPENPGAGRPTK